MGATHNVNDICPCAKLVTLGLFQVDSHFCRGGLVDPAEMSLLEVAYGKLFGDILLYYLWVFPGLRHIEREVVLETNPESLVKTLQDVHCKHSVGVLN